jgi:toxin YoeB
MTISFTPRGWEDYLHWQTNDKEVLDTLNILIKEVTRDPFRGLGKPEPLRGNLAGYWSRRISREHRLIYRVSGTAAERIVVIIQARYHY